MARTQKRPDIQSQSTVRVLAGERGLGLGLFGGRGTVATGAIEHPAFDPSLVSPSTPSNVMVVMFCALRVLRFDAL
jgi:hypothetical protein